MEIHLYLNLWNKNLLSVFSSLLLILIYFFEIFISSNFSFRAVRNFQHCCDLLLTDYIKSRLYFDFYYFASLLPKTPQNLLLLRSNEEESLWFLLVLTFSFFWSSFKGGLGWQYLHHFQDWGKEKLDEFEIDRISECISSLLNLFS